MSDLNRSESRDLIFIPVPDVVTYFMPLTPALGRLRPESSEFKARLDYNNILSFAGQMAPCLPSNLTQSLSPRTCIEERELTLASCPLTFCRLWHKYMCTRVYIYTHNLFFK